MLSRQVRAISLLALVPLLGACGDRGPTAAEMLTTIASVQPAGGAVAVPVSTPIVITFSHRMKPGMEAYVALHQTDASGPIVAGTSTWSSDFTELTFTPDEPLHAAKPYTLHLGGGLRDGQNRPLDYESCLTQHGGRWTPHDGDDMVGGGHMGWGWRHQNGSDGMVFAFTTA